MSRVVIDGAGAILGRVVEVLLEVGDMVPRWLRVDLTGGGQSLVPSAAASMNAGGQIVIPYDAEVLRAAPLVSGPVISAERAADLSRYYGLSE